MMFSKGALKTSYIAIAVIVIIVIAAIAIYFTTMPTPTPITPKPTPTTPTTPTPTILTTPTPTSTPLEKITFRWGTSRVGTTGYKTLAKLTEILGKEMPNYDFSVIATPGAAASIKDYAVRNLEGCYAGTLQFKHLYSGIGLFEGFKAERYPVQTFWCFTLDACCIIPDAKKDVYRSWADLNGKKIFTLPLAWELGMWVRDGLTLLGINYTHVEIGTDMVATSLKKGDIDAAFIYITSGISLAPWIKELEMSVDIAILNPSPDEVSRLKKAGYVFVEVNPRVFSTNVDVEKIYAIPLYYGFHVGVEMSEDTVYKILKIFEKYSKELIDYDPLFKVLEKDFAGFQVLGIKSCPEIPVHPGLAKYLKEKGLWSDEWRIAK